MNPRIQNNFYVEPFKNVRMKQMNYNGFCMEEFPQYKAFNNGLENLTSVELISLIIGTGTKKNVEQARQLFNVMKESLRNIAKARVEVLLSLYLYSILFLTSTSIFYDCGCRLSIIWLFTVQRYGGSVRYQTPGDALFC